MLHQKAETIVHASQLCLQKGLSYTYLSYYKPNIATFISVLNIMITMSTCILFFIIITI